MTLLSEDTVKNPSDRACMMPFMIMSYTDKSSKAYQEFCVYRIAWLQRKLLSVQNISAVEYVRNVGKYL